MQLTKKQSSQPIKAYSIKVNLQGSKHAFSRIFPFFLLFNKGALRNVPDILDVHIQISFMQQLGYRLQYDGKTLHHEGKRKQEVISTVDNNMYKYSRSLINLFPLLKDENINLHKPQGCPIGKRDISWYLSIMEEFGIHVTEVKGMYQITDKAVEQYPSRIEIKNKSFSSTNIAILCTLIKKRNVEIYNPSTEPEIENLVEFLQTTNVQISWDENKTKLVVDGSTLDPSTQVDFELTSDRNQAVTYAIGAILLKKNITIVGNRNLKMWPFLRFLSDLEIKHSTNYQKNVIQIFAKDSDISHSTIRLVTGPYPTFCSDWQPLVATLAVLGAKIHIRENLFESRFRYLDEYKKFGILHKKTSSGEVFIYRSRRALSKGEIDAYAHDLRCGAGLGLLSLLQKEQTTIKNAIQIQRGYENFAHNLQSLYGEDIFKTSE